MSEVEAVLERIAAEGIKVVDFRFTDLGGRWRHVSRQATGIDAACLREGVLIDGSAVPGWREVTESDLLLRPDCASAWLDPFSAQATLVLLCDGAEPASGLGYERDPRSTAQRAEAYLAGLKVADQVRLQAELGFYLFDDLKLETGPWAAGYSFAPTAGRAVLAARRVMGSEPSFLAAPPLDAGADIRAEITSIAAALGLDELGHGHGPGLGQNEIGFAAHGLTRAADQVQTLRYVAHMVAASYGKQACFLPKPISDEPGSALRVHQSLWRGDRPAFAGQGYADLSPACLHFIAGIIAHARALNAFTNPTTNSYRRLRFGQGEPVLLAYAVHNRSTALRIPYAASPQGKRVELRFPDPSANPYLAFAAILMAGLDGVERRLEAGEPSDRNLYDLPAEEAQDIPAVCKSLDEALDALDQDHEFLTKGEVMPKELVQAYVRLKRQQLAAVERMPHPAEFALDGY